MRELFRRLLYRLLVVTALLVTLIGPLSGPALAKEIEFQIIVLSREGNTVLGKTSGNETLPFDMSWLKNPNEFAFRRDDFLCITADQLPDGKLMVTAVKSCDEPKEDEEEEEHEREEKER
jgi:hypothetical protein